MLHSRRHRSHHRSPRQECRDGGQPSDHGRASLGNEPRAEGLPQDHLGEGERDHEGSWKGLSRKRWWHGLHQSHSSSEGVLGLNLEFLIHYLPKMILIACMHFKVGQ